MFDKKKDTVLELFNLILDSIHVIENQTQIIKKADDFLISPDKMFILDGVCMKLIFIGESIKSIDKISNGQLLNHYSSIPWKQIMGLRDIIVHHYFRIDADEIFLTIKRDLLPLKEAVLQIIKDLSE